MSLSSEEEEEEEEEEDFMKYQLELGRIFIPQLEETLHTPRAVKARCPPAVLQVTTKL